MILWMIMIIGLFTSSSLIIRRSRHNYHGRFFSTTIIMTTASNNNHRHQFGVSAFRSSILKKNNNNVGTTKTFIVGNRRSSSDGSSLSSSPSRLLSSALSPLDEIFFLNQVETTVSNVLNQTYNNNRSNSSNSSSNNDVDVSADISIEDIDNMDIMALPEGTEREAFGIARHLHRRLSSLRRNNDCPRCWMQRAHCICSHCKPVVSSSTTTISIGDHDHNSNDINNHNNNNNSDNNNNNNNNQTTNSVGGDGSSSGRSSSSTLRRIFLIMHHKEIGLKVDTAKLILASFPFQCELVIGGVGPEYQHSMKDLLESIDDPTITSLVLFPDESANTLNEIIMMNDVVGSNSENNNNNTNKSSSNGGRNLQNDKKRQILCDDKEDHNNNNNDCYDLIVLDGTWAQARKFHSRYFPSSVEDDENNNDDNDNDDDYTFHHSRRKKKLRHVKLSEESVQLLQDGSTQTGEHQLRRHEIPWRQVGTFEAFRLFLRDWSREFPNNNNFANIKENDDDSNVEAWEKIGLYQRIANDAARRELPPSRKKVQ
jgi:DTW domain-containing protein YfiP